MNDDKAIKLYPGWKEAADRILKRWENEGYGILISFQELHGYMDITEPRNGTSAQWKSYSFEVLQATENLKKYLLEEHLLHLENVRGQGYMVLHPNDQVTIAANKLFKKAMFKVNQTIKLLTHVDMSSLSEEGKQSQLLQLEKAAWLKASFRGKRKFPGPQDKLKLVGPEEK